MIKFKVTIEKFNYNNNQVTDLNTIEETIEVGISVSSLLIDSIISISIQMNFWLCKLKRKFVDLKIDSYFF